MIEVALISKAGHFLVFLVDDVTIASVWTCVRLWLLLTVSVISPAEPTPLRDTNQNCPKGYGGKNVSTPSPQHNSSAHQQTYSRHRDRVCYSPWPKGRSREQLMNRNIQVPVWGLPATVYQLRQVYWIIYQRFWETPPPHTHILSLL